MKKLVLQINEDFAEKIEWLLAHFTKEEIEITHLQEYIEKHIAASNKYIDELEEALEKATTQLNTANQKIGELGEIIEHGFSFQKNLTAQLSAATQKIADLEQYTDKYRELDKKLTEQKISTLMQNNFSLPQEKIDGKFIILGIPNLNSKIEESLYDAKVYFDKSCPYCKENLFIKSPRDKIEIDHFIPVSRGGQDLPWNLLPVCKTCNRKKGSKLPHEFLDAETVEVCTNYLHSVYEKYFSESIDSYSDTKEIRKLIYREHDFLLRNHNEEFVLDLVSKITPEFIKDMNPLMSMHNVDNLIINNLPAKEALESIERFIVSKFEFNLEKDNLKRRKYQYTVSQLLTATDIFIIAEYQHPIEKSLLIKLGKVLNEKMKISQKMTKRGKMYHMPNLRIDKKS